MKTVEVKGINTDRFNPFNANDEELIVHALNDAGLLMIETTVNDLPAEKFLNSFLEKRTLYRDATRLGAVLIESGKIHQDKLQEALLYQEKHKEMKLGEIFVKLGLCTASEIKSLLKIQKQKRIHV